MSTFHVRKVQFDTSRVDACIRLPVGEYKGGALGCRSASVVQEVEVAVFVNGNFFTHLTCSPWGIRECVIGVLFFRGALESRLDLMDYSFDSSCCSAFVKVKKSLQLLQQKEQSRRTGDDLLKDSVTDASKKVYLDQQITVEGVNILIDSLERGSLLFRRTGGVHSAALASLSEILYRQEDISRQAAVDKLAGFCILEEVKMSDRVLLFSGRMPYEIISKVVKMGCPIIVSPGAPTDLSVKLGERCGVTLIGFAKNGCFNVYSHPERIVVSGESQILKVG